MSEFWKNLCGQFNIKPLPKIGPIPKNVVIKQMELINGHWARKFSIIKTTLAEKTQEFSLEYQGSPDSNLHWNIPIADIRTARWLAEAFKQLVNEMENNQDYLAILCENETISYAQFIEGKVP